MTVTVRMLAPGDEPAVAALLAQHADSSLFLRRNLATSGLEDRGARYQGTWAGAFAGTDLVAVAEHTRWGTVLLQAPVHPGAVAREVVRASGRAVRGFVGPWAQTLAAREALGLDHAPMRMESHEGLYAVALDALIVPETLMAEGWRCRRARPDELDLLVRWRVQYNVELNAETDGPGLHEASREEIQDGLDERVSWVLEVRGEPVAYQQFNAVLPDVVQVGGVWTPPALRSRGYARSVVAGSLLAVRADGIERGVLFTGEANLPARRAYTALGFQRIGDWGLLSLATPTRPR